MRIFKRKNKKTEVQVSDEELYLKTHPKVDALPLSTFYCEKALKEHLLIEESKIREAERLKKWKEEKRGEM